MIGTKFFPVRGDFTQPYYMLADVEYYIIRIVIWQNARAHELHPFWLADLTRRQGQRGYAKGVLFCPNLI